MRGPARVDRRTGSLLDRLRPGDVAVLDHLDLDRATAQALVDGGVVAVVNASSFISGRYPNLGPQLLAGAGVADGGRRRDRASSPTPGRRHRSGCTTAPSWSAAPAGRRRARARPRPRSPTLMEDARSGAVRAAAEPHPQHHRVPAPRAGAAAARPRASPRPGPTSRAVRSWWSRAATTTARTCAGCGGSSASSARCWSAWTPAPTRCWRPATGPTSSSSARRAWPRAAPAATRGSTVSDKALRAAREVVLHADQLQQAAGADRLDRLGVRAPDPEPPPARSEDVALLLADVRRRRPRSSPSARTRRSTSSSTGSATASPARSSSGCGSAPSWSTPRASRAVRRPRAAVAPGARAARRARRAGSRRAGDPGRPGLVVAARRRPVRRTRLDPGALRVISFRYHVVSIVAVLLALAVGVALGGGPLRDGRHRAGRPAATPIAGPPSWRPRSTRLRAGDRFADDFATTVAPGLLGRTLRGRGRDARGAAHRPARRTSARSRSWSRVAGGTRRRHAARRHGTGRRGRQAARRRARHPAGEPAAGGERAHRTPGPTSGSAP